jgi:hypothetical protein
MFLKRRRGKQLDGRPLPVDTIRFLRRVLVDKASGCWIWQGYKCPKFGYGQFRLIGRTQWAHRVAYLIFKGTVPKGMTVHHDREKCANPQCVNPDHLELLTDAENVAEANRARAVKEVAPF